MNKESIEELRQRLLADSQVRDMIAMRAYEIYQRRGGGSGGEAEDWFRAEHEILSFLIVEESRRTEEETRKAGEDRHKNETATSQGDASSSRGSMSLDEQGEGPRAFEPRTEPEIAERHEAPAGQTADERARSQSELGAWSATEPESALRAPSISPEEPKGKKARKTATRKPKAEAKEAAPKKKTAARKSTKKTATAKNGVAEEGEAKKPAARKPGSKKSAEEKGKQ